jgi:hypothetical protein
VLAVATILAAGASASGTSHWTLAGDPSAAEQARPHVLHDAIANVLVRVDGSTVCSGTPLTDTPFVVTAAHCVLDPAGGVSAVIVSRDGVERAPTEILVDERSRGCIDRMRTSTSSCSPQTLLAWCRYWHARITCGPMPLGR